MSGAAILCGSAALRSGAGLVFVAVPEGTLPIVAAGNPCYLTVPLPQDEQGVLSETAETQLLGEVEKATVAALGPGLGHGPGITALVTTVLARSHKPLVLDADALNALQGHTHCLNQRSGPVILTPHPGEFARLIGSDVASVQARRQALATAFAGEHQLVLVLKGYRTIVTDGQRIYINNTGNAGMATGGTGDVLTGLIAALLAQGLDPFGAAQLGVYLHGVAGDLARDAVGEVSLIASDLLAYLPRAIQGS
jgi:NAD(P)H-hydrate epimerase